MKMVACLVIILIVIDLFMKGCFLRYKITTRTYSYSDFAIAVITTAMIGALALRVLEVI